MSAVWLKPHVALGGGVMPVVTAALVPWMFGENRQPGTMMANHLVEHGPYGDVGPR